MKEGNDKFLKLALKNESDCIYVNMRDAIENQVVERFELHGMNPTSIPMDVGKTLDESAMELNKPYRELIGTIGHIRNFGRPDIAFATTYLQRFNDKASMVHWKAATKLGSYLATTQDYALKFTKGSERGIEAYVDSSFAEVPDRKSTTGYVILYGGVAVVWKSSKQKNVTLSSMESEYVAASECVRDVIFVQNLLKDIGIEENHQAILYEDNNATLANLNGQDTKRTRHIDVSAKFIIEKARQGRIKFERVSTKENIADALTKALPTTIFETYRTRMGVVKMPIVGGVLKCSYKSDKKCTTMCIVMDVNTE
jgi:hypothetical protein